jgi:cytochrome c oxidase subunit 1
VHLPVISSRDPLWTDSPDPQVVTGLRTDRREVLVTTTLEASPDHRGVLPGSSIWPFVTSLGASIGLAGSIFYFSFYYVALVLALIGLIGWFWARPPLELEP